MKIRKCLAVLSLVALLFAGAAQAALNPASPGLPLANAYGQTGLANNAASAMCVDCHTRNPAVRTAPLFATGYTPTRADVNGSHYVMETPALAHSGGGWADDRWTGAQYKNGKYMKGTAWGATSNANMSGAWSKWSNATYVSLPARSAAAPADLAVGDYGTICESCHNIVLNAPYGGSGGGTPPANKGNKKLLAWTTNNMDTAAAYLCEGCHAQMKATATAGNNDAGNNKANQAVGRDHHVLTADPITGALAATGRLWGADWAWADVSAIAMGNSAEPASYPNRIRADAIAGGDVDTVTAANINCTHCHRAHNAQTLAGGLILKSGNGTNLTGKGTTTTTATNYGIQRQFDTGNKESATTKLLGNESNLCDGCHLGYK